ncbi:hypothetical protein JHK85_010140 [Glycine max]|nr:hypothetical protein JHK85_010140 [Glycine max]
MSFFVYAKDFVSWGVACLILTIFVALNIIAFYVGKPFYRYRRLQGNPFMPILQVLIAAIRKRNLLCPSNPASMSENFQGRLLSHTSRLSKKAIKRARCRLRLLKNKRQAIARQLRKDLAKLIQSGHEETAFNRICLLMPHTHLLTTACGTIFFETG